MLLLGRLAPLQHADHVWKAIHATYGSVPAHDVMNYVVFCDVATCKQ